MNDEHPSSPNQLIRPKREVLGVGEDDRVMEEEKTEVTQAECGEEDAVTPFRREEHHLPSIAEQKTHQLTHVPYRPWCEACVAGRKANWAHKSEDKKREKGAVPEVHVDYCFLRNKRGGESIPVLVLKDRDSKALAAHVVPYKGGDLEWAVKQSVRDFAK